MLHMDCIGEHALRDIGRTGCNFTARPNSLGYGLTEVADVIKGLDCLDFETGIAGYFKLLAAFVSCPLVLTLEPDPAFAGIEFHDLRGAGIENQ